MRMSLSGIVAVAFLVAVDAGRALRRSQVLNTSSATPADSSVTDEDEPALVTDSSVNDQLVAEPALDYNATAAELANATAEMTTGESLAKNAFEQASRMPGFLNASIISAVASTSDKGWTFQTWYASHQNGRGLWKWSNALDAYQRHFARWSGHAVNVAEVGVQSGGSISMWQAVLGQHCYVHGLDINPNCRQFQNQRTSITIGDQAQPKMWYQFFTAHPTLDLLVDDGGHEANQMLTTFLEVFYRLRPGGAIAIEDIHGEHYVNSFFTPCAKYLGHMHNRGKLQSVHLYPFLLVARRAGKTNLPTPALRFHATNRAYVNNFNAMWQQINKHKGGVVILKNSKWGSFLSAQSLTNFFAHFGALHVFNMFDTPAGCKSTASPNCATTVRNSPQQNLVTGVHVYHNELYVEVAPKTPVITAVRKGNKFIKYG